MVPVPALHRVLVVDDQPRVRREMKRLLQHAGFDVLVADGYDEAMATAPPDLDLAIIELDLPGRSGIELVGDLLAAHSRSW